jgi:NAD(P)-dependent dehydrogenase (short-subunit alcohol dehydrogenase family)
LARLREIAPGVEHTVHYADLSVISEMKRAAGEIAAAEARIDVLINNAGAMFSRRYETADGLELTFALNHVAYFVITQGLMERLKSSGAARIVSTASDAHKMGTLDFEDLQSVKVRPGFKVYGTSKLCNILFTRELARRLAGTGVTANCLHPGFVATRFGEATGGLMSFGIGIAKRFALTPEDGAKTLVYLASSEDVAGVSGKYFHECRAIAPSAAAQDDGAAQRLWEETSKAASMAS